MQAGGDAPKTIGKRKQRRTQQEKALVGESIYEKKGLNPQIQKVFQWILVVFGVLNNILKVYQNRPPILVIALSIFPSLQDLGLQQLWVAFGHGVSLRWISVHDLYHVIGPVKTKGI